MALGAAEVICTCFEGREGQDPSCPVRGIDVREGVLIQGLGSVLSRLGQVALRGG